MKTKFRYLQLILFILLLTGCKNKQLDLNSLAEEFISTLEINWETDENISLPNEYIHKNDIYSVFWISDDENIITNDGIITRKFIDQETELSFRISDKEHSFEKYFGKITVLGFTKEEILSEIRQQVFFPSETSENLILPSNVNIFSTNLLLRWESSNLDVLSNQGFIYPRAIAVPVNLKLYVLVANTEYEYNFAEISILPYAPELYLESIINTITIPIETKTDIVLPTKIGDVSIQWLTSDKSVLTATGKWNFCKNDTTVTLTAIFNYNGYFSEKEYTVIVKTYTDLERLNLVYDTVNLPETTQTNLALPTTFNYFVTGTWSSSNPSIISNFGIVNLTSQNQQVKMTLKLKSGDQTMEKEFTVTTASINNHEQFINSHILVQKTPDFDFASLNNLKIENGKIVLNEAVLEGSYESKIFKTQNYNRLVGSWSAISSTDATCELQIRVRVNGQWSSYLTYSKWGLGLQNKMNDQNNGISQMADDEILINNSQYSDGFQYRFILRRDTLFTVSPKLSLVAISLNIPNYVYQVDTSMLPSNYDIEVPKLYQHTVPTIGNSICSPTSSTMLLLYKGISFQDELPHREVAYLFRDYGNNIYGNWVYNTVGMSAYGFNSYVKRIYSFEELKHHLYTVGPVALSIKGNTGLYTTGGHLIVVRGWEVVNNTTYIICNDPNVSYVTVKYTLDVFNTVSRNVIYVIE